jgi:hypothetical protein
VGDRVSSQALRKGFDVFTPWSIFDGNRIWYHDFTSGVLAGCTNTIFLELFYRKPKRNESACLPLCAKRGSKAKMTSIMPETGIELARRDPFSGF